ncbi:imidazole glycerol phosphate synthase subunit HisH [Aequorivita lipolytica]|uniref:Imidazole glycerol phosphate synthase subunit HisH n=1 Tax=Aequorivita lipolytica TaxID=153267 RepID=A0A5C6YNJ4_9FLAO|nr:imidazole glycerol phosphate synthase subunit HisH [Aequorivita lipolytica]TXD68598.1 imidazole glycerol phosphate synthase subunit HisH [Aequorivita lipolytica]SRX53251.1 Imidazole glycerol phosphate synthase subunit HisH [Aequorivita lipolytica]
MIVIIDYEVGNLTSIKKMLKKVGCADALISGKHEDIENASKLILPGVGHFDYGMDKLHSSGLVDLLNKKVLQEKIPILGICLGAQLLTRGSEEGSQKGLGWIAADTVKFDASKFDQNLKVPHMGWSEVSFKKHAPLFSDMPEESRFYFVHTYHIDCDNPEDIAVTAKYGYGFTAGFIKENIIGMQFHPEKSHKYGMQLLSNFIKNY